MGATESIRAVWSRIAQVREDFGVARKERGRSSGGTSKLLIVSHDAHLDGAPLLILHVAQVLRRELGLYQSQSVMGSSPWMHVGY